MGLREDGTIAVWGDTNYGQLDVPEPNDGFVALATSGGHALGLKEDGSIVAWGENCWGQCSVPEPNQGFTAVAAGSGHSLGLRGDGSIVAWGDNFAGQCDVPEPNQGYTAIAAGSAHSLSINTDFTVDPYIPDALRIIRVSPAPFSGDVSIVFESPGLGSVDMQIFDIAGRMVYSCDLGPASTGLHDAFWSNCGGPGEAESYANGVYIVRLVGGGTTSSARIVQAR